MNTKSILTTVFTSKRLLVFVGGRIQN